MSIDFLLFVGSAICFFLATIGRPASPIDLKALGLLLFVLTFIV